MIAYNDEEVVIRDPLGPTSTNGNRPYQYRVRWERFLDVFAAQGNDGLAVMAPEGARSVQVSGTTEASDATPEASATEAATPEATPAPVDFAVGDIVEVADDPQSLPLNFREEATTGSEIIDELDPGTRLEITGEAIQADGYRWYPVGGRKRRDGSLSRITSSPPPTDVERKNPTSLCRPGLSSTGARYHRR